MFSTENEKLEWEAIALGFKWIQSFLSSSICLAVKKIFLKYKHDKWLKINLKSYEMSLYLIK